MQVREQISAGGVAFRVINCEIVAAIVLMIPEMRWQLPKGIIDPGETPEQAALREVREEAGIDCELIAPIDIIEYWFVDRRSDEPVRIHKFVHFFLMEYRSGDVSDYDDEIAEARWASLDEAFSMLAFESERDVLRKAFEIRAASTQT
ncbi:MAG: NUDIX hydrolase [Blastocatellia bacterium]